MPCPGLCVKGGWCSWALLDAILSLPHMHAPACRPVARRLVFRNSSVSPSNKPVPDSPPPACLPHQLGIVGEMRETGSKLAGGLQAAGEALGVTGGGKKGD